MWPRYHMFFRKQYLVLASGKWVNFGSAECTEISLVWNQLIISSCFEVAMWCPKISSSRRTGSVSCQEWTYLWHCSTSKIFHAMLATLLLKRKVQHLGQIQIVLWVSGSVGQQVWLTFNPDVCSCSCIFPD